MNDLDDPVIRVGFGQPVFLKQPDEGQQKAQPPIDRGRLEPCIGEDTHGRVPAFKFRSRFRHVGTALMAAALLGHGTYPVFKEEGEMLKKLLLSTALSAAVATVAFGQSSDTPKSSEPAPAAQSQGSGKNFVSSQKPDQFLASKFKGTEVMGSDNQKIGDVSDILFDKTGKIEAYVIEKVAATEL